MNGAVERVDSAADRALDRTRSARLIGLAAALAVVATVISLLP